MKIHVMHVISGLGVGGAEHMLEQLALRLDRDLFRQTVVSLSSVGPIGESLQRAGGQVTALGMPRGIPMPGSAARLRRMVSEVQPDIVQTWMYHADLAGALALSRRGRPELIWNIRGSARNLQEYGLRTWAVVLACARLSRIPQVVVANSERGKLDHVRMGYHPRRWAVIPNGVDVRRFKPDPLIRAQVRAELEVGDDEFVVGCIARYHPMKGHKDLVQALGLLIPRQPSIVLVLAGQGTDPSNRTLNARLLQSGLSANVRLLGARSDVDRLMTGMDALVLSSRAGEGFPNVVAEAMATGIPPVVTDVGDAAALVGDAGLVVPPRDPQAVGAALEQLVEMSEALRRQLGRKARERVVSSYSVDSMLNAYAALYAGILRSPSDARQANRSPEEHTGTDVQ